jgi:hypothetical protein
MMTNAKKGAQHNAITHGIFAGVFLSDSGSVEAEEFHKLLAAATEAIRPENGLVEALVQKLAVLFLRLRRVYKADFEIAPKLFVRVEDALTSKNSFLDLGLDEKDTNRGPTMDTVVRYETTISREIGRTLTQIQQLRRMLEIDIAPISQGGKPPEPGPSSVLPDSGLHP